jgi:hypothetical protein
MTQVKPFIKCVDFWPVQIPPEKLAAYKQLIDEGQIRKHHVIYNRTAGSTTVEYYAIAPHEWILKQLKERSEDYGTEQTCMQFGDG